MKSNAIRLGMLLMAMSLFTSCEAIEGIFKAGMGFGIFLVIAGIAVVIFIISKVFGKKGG
ncbi:hypothetical protein [Flavobacterium humi]|uniref:Phosphatidate cytidylyltransferase n=1 Tax=Flavobacterium humi TaxID=2562683 RepID=A0A4Z0LCV4_9FLAO|nr:hypothetical protein [Flavobacterium humi]TGD59716.1 hypothetical protein E4635_01920 [Flavobacterium humi]